MRLSKGDLGEYACIAGNKFGTSIKTIVSYETFDGCLSFKIPWKVLLNKT
jgi:hypothetical protein